MTVALFTRTPNASSSRQSAGTSSPAVRKITSPGTTSSGGITTTTPLPLHSDLMRQQTLQRVHRLFGSMLLPERKRAVDHDDADDRERERGHPLPRHLEVGDEGQERSQPEQDGEEVRELREETEDDRRLPEPLDAVGSELEPASGGVCS